MKKHLFRYAALLSLCVVACLFSGCKTMDGLVMTGQGMYEDSKVLWGSMVKADDWMRKDFW